MRGLLYVLYIKEAEHYQGCRLNCYYARLRARAVKTLTKNISAYSVQFRTMSKDYLTDLPDYALFLCVLSYGTAPSNNVLAHALDLFHEGDVRAFLTIVIVRFANSHMRIRARS